MLIGPGALPWYSWGQIGAKGDSTSLILATAWDHHQVVNGKESTIWFNGWRHLLPSLKPEFSVQKLQGRRELTSASCPLTSMHVFRHTHTHFFFLMKEGGKGTRFEVQCRISLWPFVSKSLFTQVRA